MGTKEAEPKDLGLDQIRMFVHDCKLLDDGVLDVEVQHCVQQVLNNGALAPQQGDPSLQRRRNSFSLRADRLKEADFVACLCRLSYLWFNRIAEKPSGSLAKCFNTFMEDRIIPNAVFELRDELSEAIESNPVQRVLKKHKAKLYEQYYRWSASDRGGGAQSDTSTMSLGELMTALGESKIVDTLCTVKEVTTFFVMTNADDELKVKDESEALSSKNGSAELDFDEFCEICVRVCNEKVPPPHEVPFDQVLDTWLGLQFLPALRNAGKGIVADRVEARLGVHSEE